MKSLKKVFLLGVATTSIFSACSTKEDADYKPYKKHDSIEVAKGEEEASKPTRVEGVAEDTSEETTKPVEEKVKSDTSALESSRKEGATEGNTEVPKLEDSEINDRRPWYKDVNMDSSSVSLNEYNAIQVGMSANKVRELAGSPRMIEKYKTFSTYGYLSHSDTGSMTIYFDANGTVTKKEKSNLYEAIKYIPDDELEANEGHEDHAIGNHDHNPAPVELDENGRSKGLINEEDRQAVEQANE